MPREELEHSIAIGLERDADWTFNCPTAAPEMSMEWMGLYGTWSQNYEPAKEWLSSLTPMQLCAVCVMGRWLESVNIPYIVATKLKRTWLKRYLRAVNQHWYFNTHKDLVAGFENFLFYFDIGKEASGAAPEFTESKPTKRSRKDKPKGTAPKTTKSKRLPPGKKPAAGKRAGK